MKPREAIILAATIAPGETDRHCGLFRSGAYQYAPPARASLGDQQGPLHQPEQRLGRHVYGEELYCRGQHSYKRNNNCAADEDT